MSAVAPARIRTTTWLHAPFVRPGLALGAGLFFACTVPPLSWTVSAPVGLAVFAGLLFLTDTATLTTEDANVTPRSRVHALANSCGCLGWLFGVGANLVALSFVPRVITNFTELNHPIAALALITLAATQALPFILAGLLFSRLRQFNLPAPVAFASAMYASHIVPTVFPWTPAGAIATWTVAIQSAEIWGERGVSALLCLLAAGCAQIGLRWSTATDSAWRVRQLGYLALALMGIGGSGYWRMRNVQQARVTAPHVNIGLVNPATDAKVRWDPKAAPAILSNLQRLSEQAEAAEAFITVWPEAAYPYALAHVARTGPLGHESVLGSTLHGPVLFGVVLVRGRGDSTNSAVLVGPDGALSAPSDKQFLLPFGEHIPFAEELPILRRAFARGTGLVAGERTVFQRWGNVRASVLNCFEDTRTDASRQLATDNSTEPGAYPNLLVNVTNDAWFAGTFESELHSRLATLRAVEQRRDLVRAVNFGRGGLIHATGEVDANPMPATPSAQVVNVALIEGPTLFARFGDTPLTCVWLVVLVSAFGLKLRARRSAR
jgi:apolipoprotein N-acyltransferase